MSSKFDFDTLLGCICRVIEKDRYLINQFAAYLQPEHFFPDHKEGSRNLDEEGFKKILKIILDHHRESTWKTLTLETMATEVSNMPDGEMREVCIKLVRRMQTDKAIHAKSRDDGCLGLFMDYLKVIAIQLWSRGFSRDYQNGKINDAIQKMRDFIPQLDRIGFKDYSTLNADELYDKLLRQSQVQLDTFKIGIASLDGASGSGWYETQTLNAFVGSTGAGKSMMTITLAVQAISQHKGCHITIVEDKERTFESRIVAALTNIPINRIKHNMHQLTSEEDRRIRLAISMIGKYLKVDYIYGQGIDFIHQQKINDDIRRDYEGKPRFEVDIVDYSGHIALHAFGDKMYEKYKNVYSARKDFALKHNKFAFDFIQVNRDGNKKNSSGSSGYLSEADLAGAYDISHVCDTIVSINRSDSQAAENKATLYVTKGREGGKGMKIDVATSFHLGKFDFSSSKETTVLL